MKDIVLNSLVAISRSYFICIYGNSFKEMFGL